MVEVANTSVTSQMTPTKCYTRVGETSLVVAGLFNHIKGTASDISVSSDSFYGITIAEVINKCCNNQKGKTFAC